MANILEPIKNTKNLRSLFTNLLHRGPLNHAGRIRGLGSHGLQYPDNLLDSLRCFLQVYSQLVPAIFSVIVRTRNRAW